MGDTENIVCNYCDARLSQLLIIAVIVSTLILLKTGYKSVPKIMYVKMGKLSRYVNDNYRNIVRLLLLKIIVNSKNWMISIINLREYHS